MNVLIISPGVYPVPAVNGGAVENLIEILVKSEAVTKKHNITLYTIYNKKAEKESKMLKCNVKYIHTDRKLYQIQRIIRHIINRFTNKYIGNQYIHSVVKNIKKEKEKYDIIIIENEPEYGMVVKKIKKNAKMILHLHNDYLNIYTKNARQILSCYDRIFSISEYISQRVNQIDVSKVKSKILYNGIDTSRFNPQNYDKKKLKEKYGFDKNDFIFMYSGRIVPEKGVKEMVQAFCKLNDNRSKLLIIGNKAKGQENYYNEIVNIAKKREQDIFFKGYVDYKKIAELYSLADIGIVPSIWDEPFGLVVVEFMASSIPLIVSDKGAMKEIVNLESICGEIVKKDENYIENLKKAMLFYLELQTDKMQERKKNAIMNAKRFTKEIYIENFLKLIEEEKNEK